MKKKAKKTKSPAAKWKWTVIIGTVFTLGFAFATVIASIVDNPLAIFINGQSWKLVDEDPSAVYYESDFETQDELLAYGRQVSRQVEAEGAVLLKNENKVLPLSLGSKVSFFSTSSVNLIYGGTGSGVVDNKTADTLKTAAEKAGLIVNETLWEFYENGLPSKYSRPVAGYIPIKSAFYEAPWSFYTEEVLKSVEDYSDAAIIVLSRQGGEHFNLEYQEFDYLSLNEEEHELFRNVTQLKADGKVKKVILLINSANTLTMDFLKEYDIDACLHIGLVGQYGINAVADILTGAVNPSGSLTDTWCYDNFAAPEMYNFTPVEYEDAKELGVPGDADSYVIYQEGIYTGYRYYETRYEDFVMGTGNAGDYQYDALVTYPFGHGLSYTEFSYSDMTVTYLEESDQYEVSILVTNTADAAGMETVQLYVQSPYTEYDREHGVEKSAVTLCGYDKTAILDPGEQELVTITVNKKDLASYDSYGAGTYILDAGEYYFTIATDAHTAVNQILAAKGYTPENTDGRMTAAGDETLTWKWEEETLDTTTYAVSANGTAITNKLSDADPNLYEGIKEEITWLSRSDWMGTFPVETVKLTLTELLVEDLQHKQYDPEEADVSGYEMPVMGADNGLTLQDMIGKAADDPDWDRLVEQMTYDEMVTMIADAFHVKSATLSVQAPGSRAENGPSGLNTILLAYEAYATAFPVESVMAATFHDDLIYEVGRIIGNDCLMSGVTDLYGPGVNLHRTAYGGRNFEYFSEDPFLSGKMCAAEVRGIEDKGINTLLKHFALNESEADRIGLGVWLNEQTAREIYLKAFQFALEEEHANGIMAAYTRWGATWSGGYRDLVTGILREEWGCNGWMTSDNVMTTMITGADGLIAGITTFDAAFPPLLRFSQYKDDPYIVSLMQDACQRMLYSMANSSAMNGIGENTSIELVEYVMITLFRWLSIGSLLLVLTAAYMWRRKAAKAAGQ